MKINRIIIFSFFSILVLWSFSTNKSIAKDVQDEIISRTVLTQL